MGALDNVYCEINLNNLIDNLNFVRLKSNKEVIGVVKDNAYGHGAYEVSKCLVDNGVKVLAVSSLSEGVYLRDRGIKEDILILGVTNPLFVKDIIYYNLIQTITGHEYYKLLCENLKGTMDPLRVHIKIDTGMGRVGLFASDENLKIVNTMCSNPLFLVEGIYSHLSDADNTHREYTLNQHKLFTTFCNNIDDMKLNIKYKHICNSAGSINYNFPNVNYVRPGLLLYGYDPCNRHIGLKRVMSLKSKIVHINKIRKGQFIGYSKTYKAQRDMIVGTLNIGYGHGYPRYLSNKGRVIVNGKYARIVGNICMDHLMIDITDIYDVKLFDDVILIGEYGESLIDAHEIANYGGTICYEVICGIRKKVSRIYLED